MALIMKDGVCDKSKRNKFLWNILQGCKVKTRIFSSLIYIYIYTFFSRGGKLCNVAIFGGLV